MRKGERERERERERRMLYIPFLVSKIISRAMCTYMYTCTYKLQHIADDVASSKKCIEDARTRMLLS